MGKLILLLRGISQSHLDILLELRKLWVLTNYVMLFEVVLHWELKLLVTYRSTN